MTDKERTKVSKFMSLILRHNPAKVGITLDKNGWADVAALIEGINSTGGMKITLDMIKEVVATSDKQRFKFSDDGAKIRANQGHSMAVDVELKEVNPPAVLYHGTAKHFVASIKENGLKPRNRLYVHLSGDRKTAEKVGIRHGKPVILTIGAHKMSLDGHKFYLSENGVWLTKAVPTEYITF